MSTFEDGSPKQELARVNATFQAQVGLSSNSEVNGLLALGSAWNKTSNGTIIAREVEADTLRRLRVDKDTLLFSEPWLTSTVSTDKWSSISEPFQASLYPSPGLLDLVLEADADSGYTAGIRSYAPIPIMIPETEIVLAFSASYSHVGGNQSRINVGFIAADFTDFNFDEGVYVRFNDGTGGMDIALKHNTNAVYSNAIDPTVVPPGWSSALIPSNTMRHYRIVVGLSYVSLWVGNENLEFVRAASIDTSAYPFPVLKPTTLYFAPIMLRMRSVAYIASQVTFRVGCISVYARGHFASLDRSVPTSVSGRSASQTQHTTYKSTANLGDGTTPTSLTLSNTTATLTDMGGRFQFNAIAGAETDYIVCAYALTNSSDLGLLIRGVRVDLVNTGAAVATNPTIIEWFLCYGSTGTSLATAESTSTKADRRVYLGVQSFVVGAVIGSVGQALDATLDAPVYAPPGSYIKIGCRVFSGAATGSEIFRGAASVIGDWVS